jgi:hypothetical protein
MVFAFPLTPPNLIDLFATGTGENAIASVSWNLIFQQEFSGLGTGEGLAHDLGPALWEAQVETHPFYTREVEKWRARFLGLDGSSQSFMLYNPAAKYPETDPNGAILAGATITIGSVGSNRKEMALSGLPAGFEVPWGAYAQITAGSPSRVALVQFLESKTATGLGNTSAIELRPHLRPWVAAGASVQLLKPAAKVKLVPNSLRVETAGALTSRLRFTARQTLAAG